MQRHRRRDHLTPAQKEQFRTAAETFHKQLHELMRDLMAFGDGYKALLAISDAITNAYDMLGVDRPERLALSLGTRQGQP